MRHLALLLVSTLLSSHAWADSPLLPIGPTNTFRSGERAIVEAAIARAEANGKLVLIDMAAAWCGPCYRLEKEMEAKKEILAPTLAHFEFVHLEEMFLEFMNGADFMTHEIPWFPSIYVYNPANKKWSFLYATSADALKAMLEDDLANSGNGVSALYLKNLNAKISAGASIDEELIMSALIPLVVEEPGDVFLNATRSLIQAIEAKPAQFAISRADLEDSLKAAFLRGLESGKYTLAQLQAVDHLAFQDLATNANDSYRLYFGAPIGNLIRTVGNKAASDQCPTLASTSATLQKSLPANVQAEMAIRTSFQCLLLQVQLKEKTGADVASFVTNLGANDKKYAYSIMRVYALTGTDFDKAIEYGQLWKTAYESGLASSPELLARVKTATSARLAAYAAGHSHP